MNIELIPLYPCLEAAAVNGPGKHELVRMFNAHQQREPERFWTLTDSYGRVWVRPKDVPLIQQALLPAVNNNFC